MEVTMTFGEQIAEIWYALGFIRWPLALSLFTVVFLSGLSAYRLFRPGAWGDLRSKVWLDAILFWGAFATISGALGTVVGVVLAAQSIEAAGEVSTTLVAGGMKVALLSATFGLMILFFSSLIWFGLQFRWRMLVAAESNGEVTA
jgi:hypothetical protein